MTQQPIASSRRFSKFFMLPWVMVFLLIAISTPTFAACTSAPPGLVAWWGGDNNSLDIIGDQNGTPMSGASYATGLTNQAFSLDGTDDYIDIPTTTAQLINDTAGSIVTWVKPASVSGNDIIISLGGNKPGEGIGLGIWGNVRIWHYLSTYDWQSNVPVAANEWTHLVYTWDATTERIYKNGVLSDSRPRNFSYNPENARIGHGWWGDSANAFPGMIDELQLYDRTLTDAEISRLFAANSSGVCRPCTARPAGLVAWWQGEDNAADINNAYNGTLVGNTHFVSGKVKRAFDFDGNGDLVRLPKSPVWNFGTGSFSLNAWFNSSDAGIQNIISYHEYSNTQANWYLRLNAGIIQFVIGEIGSGSTHYTVLNSNSSFNDGNWHFVSAVRDAVSGELRLYVDGKVAATPLPDPGYNIVGTVDMYPSIGAAGMDSSLFEYFNGQIDEVSVYNRALSEAEAASIYNAGSTGKCACANPPNDMVGWWGGDGNAADIIGDNQGTPTNGATYTTGKVGEAFSLDGVDDFISIPDSDSLDITDTITLSTWIYRNDNRTNAGLLTKGSINVLGVYELAVYEGRFYFRLNGYDLNLPSISSIPVGVWTHVAGTYDGSTAKIYINGVLDNSQPYSTPIQTNDLPLNLGFYGNPSRYFNGAMDEVQIFNRALTEFEIRAIYLADDLGVCHQCTYRPGNAISWWQGQYDASDYMGVDDGTLVNGATFAAGKVGNAFSFDGIDDRIDFSTSSGDFGNSEFSVEFLIRYAGGEQSQLNNYVLGKSNPDTGQGWDIRLNDDSSANGKLVVTGVNGWSFNIYSQPLNPDQWYHVALVGNATDVKLYINGSVQGSSSRSTISSAPNPFRMGMTSAFGGSPFAGMIDEAAIYNRALSAKEVAAISNAACAGKCAVDDTTPDSFAFTDQQDVATGTIRVSNTLVVSGINAATVISITNCSSSNCEYMVNSGNWISSPSTVRNGDHIQARQTSSSSYGATTDLSLDIGGLTDTFSVTTLNTVPTATNLNQIWLPTDGVTHVNLDDIVITDPDVGDTLSATLSLTPTASGTLTSTSGNGEAYDTNTGVWTVTGSINQVNAALAAVTLELSSGFEVDSQISTHIQDGATTGPGDGIISIQSDLDGDGNPDITDLDDDGDNIADDSDNCQWAYNPSQQDANNDGIGNVCDPANICSGRNAVLTNTTLSGRVYCAAENSITAMGADAQILIIDFDGEVTLSAPVIELAPKVQVIQGGILKAGDNLAAP